VSRRATNGTHRNASSVMKTSSDNSNNYKHKLRISSKDQRATFQIRERHPLLRHPPQVPEVTGLAMRKVTDRSCSNLVKGIWSMDLCLVKPGTPLDKPVCLGADFENCTGPFYVVHCVNTGMRFLIDAGAEFSFLPVRNVPIGMTAQQFDVVIEGISGETQPAIGKVNLKIQPESSGKVFNVTFHIVPTAVFNLLGANFTDRYELANIIAFQAQRLRAEDTYVIARTTVVSDLKADKLTMDEARLLAAQFDLGLPTFPEPRMILDQARLDGIWRKFPHISDLERNFKLGSRMLFLQTLELTPDAKPRIARIYPQSPEALTAMKKNSINFASMSL